MDSPPTTPDPTPVLYAPIGLPGCGKTDTGQALIASGRLPEHAIVSMRALRAMVLDDPIDQTANHAVYDLGYSLANARLRHGRSVWLDATHLTSRARSRTIGLWTAAPSAHLVWVRYPTPSPVELAHTSLPPAAIRRMLDEYAGIDWAALPGYHVDAEDLVQ